METLVKKERNYGIELGRVLAMFYILILHALLQGGVFLELSAGSGKYMGAWFLEAWVLLAVDMFGTPENAPETYRLWLDLGHIYAVDAIEYDFYEHIGDYKGPVLMFQGTADFLEPKRYTDRAAEVYANVDYEVFEGVGHNFQGEVRQHVHERVDAFIAGVVGRS